jgi:hypothetical protein
MEYRICWAASSNVSFQGGGDWQPANEDETTEELENALSKGGSICNGLDIAMNESGFEWWIETR